MNVPFIPAADAIPVAWGWFQFFLLFTFPLHLLAMNAMIGVLTVGVFQQFRTGEVRKRLAHRLAVALPMIVAFVVNLGVAPLLFLQVLYGQFVYTSSILMAVFWLAVIPLLIIAYYGAYLYDFKFNSLGGAARWLGLAVLIIFLVVGYLFVNNMLLMSLPEAFAGYFGNRGGTLLVSGQQELLPRYFHMVAGALGVGGLFVALFGGYGSSRDAECTDFARNVGMKLFGGATLINIGIGTWYLVSLPREAMLLFMGGNAGATSVFVVALLLVVAVLLAAFFRRLGVTFAGAIVLVYLMSFMRAWLRSYYLGDVFRLDQLEVIPQYSPLVFFLVVLGIGSAAIGWLLTVTARALGWTGR